MLGALYLALSTKNPQISENYAHACLKCGLLSREILGGQECSVLSQLFPATDSQHLDSGLSALAIIINNN